MNRYSVYYKKLNVYKIRVNYDDLKSAIYVIYYQVKIGSNANYLSRYHVLTDNIIILTIIKHNHAVIKNVQRVR